VVDAVKLGVETFGDFLMYGMPAHVDTARSIYAVRTVTAVISYCLSDRTDHSQDVQTGPCWR
jgi:hypothetical protein